MNNCTFSYYQDIDLLKNINLKINSGDKIVLLVKVVRKSTLLTIIGFVKSK